jgi:glycosyltransferase involved in cell wall biosynthesis
MKILLDGRFMLGKPNGISHDALGILNCLAKEGHELYFLVYGKRTIPTIEKLTLPYNIYRASPYRIEILKSLLGRKIDLSWMEVDAYLQFQISPIRLKLPIGSKKILRIHDLFPVTNPEWFSAKSRFLFKRGLVNVNDFDLFLANSKTTAKLFSEFLKNPVKTIDVLKCYVDPLLNHPECGECSFCVNPINTDGVFFAVGTFEPRKNYRRLAEAFSQAMPPASLIIVGGKGWGSNSTPISKNVSIFTFKEVCEGVINLLYKNAGYFVSVSLQEGFNIPLYRAIQLGKKIVVSDIATHREAVENSNVCWVNPESVEDLTAALRTIQSIDFDLNPMTNLRDFSKEIKEILDRL